MEAVADKAVGISAVTLTGMQQAVADRITEIGCDEENSHVMTLSGSAGCGKTVTVAEAIKAIRASGPYGRALHILVAAPTHKAVSVLRDKVGAVGGLTFGSIQGALGVTMAGDDWGRRRAEYGVRDAKLSDFRLAIIDEASMLDSEMVGMIMGRRGRCSVIFVGDPAQLPPVQAGKDQDATLSGSKVSAVFDPETVGEQMILNQVIRQAAENPVLRIATNARHRIENGRDFTLMDVIDEIGPADGGYISIAYGGIPEVSRMTVSALRAGIECRALAYTNAHVSEINESVHRAMYPGDGLYVAGEPLMAYEPFEASGVDEGGGPRENQKVVIQNSATLSIIEVAEGEHPDEPRRCYEIRALCDESGDAVHFWLPADPAAYQRDVSRAFEHFRGLKDRARMAEAKSERRELEAEAGYARDNAWSLRNRYPNVKHAYAITVHKSQGSTFEASVIYWPSFLLCREPADRNRLAYVALTRTSNYTVVVGK